MFVSGFEMIPSGESGSEHENGGFWSMEISYESVDGLKFKAWINKDIVFAFGFASFGPIF